jgi:outer membrane protein assembly factor BamE (lipoprotein component of BamABCDE complex)
MRSRSVRVVWIVLAAGALSLGGCGGPKSFTPEDFEKVQKDMTEDQVRELLGGPSTTSGKSANRGFWYANVNGNYYLVAFKEGTVVEKNQFRSKNEYDAVRSYAN